MTKVSLTLINRRIKTLLKWILDEDLSQGGHGRIIIPGAIRGLALRLRMSSETLARYLAGLSAHGITAGNDEIVITNRVAVKALSDHLFFTRGSEKAIPPP